MEVIKAMSTMRMMLTDRQIHAVESIISHFDNKTIKQNLSAESGYLFIGIEDIVLNMQNDKLNYRDFCKELLNGLYPDATPTEYGKARAYDLIVNSRKFK